MNRNLKEYLKAEAAAKRRSLVDLQSGMTGKGIPLQANYSDCGLYLLAYIEKFLDNPEEFVRKSITKEMDERRDWPLFKAETLRDEFRKVVLVEGKRQNNIPLTEAEKAKSEDTGILKSDTQSSGETNWSGVQEVSNPSNVSRQTIRVEKEEKITGSDKPIADEQQQAQNTQFESAPTSPAHNLLLEDILPGIVKSSQASADEDLLLDAEPCLPHVRPTARRDGHGKETDIDEHIPAARPNVYSKSNSLPLGVPESPPQARRSTRNSPFLRDNVDLTGLDDDGSEGPEPERPRTRGKK